MLELQKTQIHQTKGGGGGRSCGFESRGGEEKSIGVRGWKETLGGSLLSLFLH